MSGGDRNADAEMELISLRQSVFGSYRPEEGMNDVSRSINAWDSSTLFCFLSNIGNRWRRLHDLHSPGRDAAFFRNGRGG